MRYETCSDSTAKSLCGAKGANLAREFPPYLRYLVPELMATKSDVVGDYLLSNFERDSSDAELVDLSDPQQFVSEKYVRN